MSDRTTLVISQPMFLPWIGLFEQIALADVYVHYDDVQMPQGRSFMARVQLRDAQGQFWLSAPVDRNASGPLISQTVLQADSSWRSKHLKTISHLYRKSPFFNEMYELIESIYARDENNLANFNAHAIEDIARWFGLGTKFKKSSEIGIKGSSSKRLLDICQHEGASRYVTGLGALKYLDHELFDKNNIAVCYMEYQKKEYAQLHFPFIPFVSILDVMANLGKRGREYMVSQALYWREYLEKYPQP